MSLHRADGPGQRYNSNGRFRRTMQGESNGVLGASVRCRGAIKRPCKASCLSIERATLSRGRSHRFKAAGR